MEPVGEYEYSKKDLIGHGAFAVVFKGRHKKKHDLTVAIKCITKKNLAKSQNLLSKEINILKELSGLHHENVVALMDCKETSHHVYLVMEYCNGGDLADFLQVKGTLSEDTIASFLRQIAGAMKALNAKGIVHRDLKPQNILLCNPSTRPNPPTTQIRLKIADFGFARFLQDGVMAATLCGSPMYMAPEVIMSLQYDAKADLWSVGTIVYQCLTGRAPFQAQTPQQLKQFYERNADLQPNVPPGTSPELRELLMVLLKRNAKDRIEFDDFFVHKFLHPPKPSSPVPVPRSASRGSSISDSPGVKAVSASPLSTNLYSSPPKVVTPLPPQKPLPVKTHEAMETGSVVEEKSLPKSAPLAEPEDYVMVPENVPAADSPPRLSQPAFILSSPKTSPKVPPRLTARSPASGRRPVPDPAPPCVTSPTTSPSRPSSLPGVAASPPHTTAAVTVPSQPIPVPSQVKAYEQIQRSIGCSPNSPSPGQRSPASVPQAQAPSPQGMSIPPRKNSASSIPSVGSMSPPSVQFCIGTPPGGAPWRRTAGSTPPCSASPLRRQPSSSPLPTILGSPNKTTFTYPSPEGVTTSDSPSSPLRLPFGNGRVGTCPDNIAAVGYKQDCKMIVAMDRSNTEPVSLMRRSQSSNGSVFSEALLKAAFPLSSPTHNSIPESQTSTTSTENRSLVRYSSANSLSSKSPATAAARHQRVSSHSGTPPTTGTLPFTAQSPPNMEGPIMFVAPELAEDVLMDKEHNETVAKLHFILALVECVIELAQSRSSPLSESVRITQRKRRGSGGFAFDQKVCFAGEGQRRLEQLVLYVRGLQLLSSSIQLARQEMMSGHLQSSATVKTLLRDMNDYYHQCLAVCRNLHSQGVNMPNDMDHTTVNADKLIYSHAIEMCQTAALDELFGNPEECFRRYRSAQILLHSLAQQAQDSKDRELLNRYKENVERRLFHLQDQGYIHAAYDNS